MIDPEVQALLDRLNEALIHAVKLLPVSATQLSRVDWSYVSLELNNATSLAQRLELETTTSNVKQTG